MNKKLVSIVILVALTVFIWLGFLGGQYFVERSNIVTIAEQTALGHSVDKVINQVALISAKKMSGNVWIVKFRGSFSPSPPPGVTPSIYSIIDITIDMHGSVLGIQMHD